ncbi:MAG TPA: hypothetical protein IAA10_07195 [Candidatus Blautia intestinavium]|nr:hypothetical protein [Candidatus Blautia intestinavium]
MAVIGAVLGDIAGSQFEFHRPADLWRRNIITALALIRSRCLSGIWMRECMGF